MRILDMMIVAVWLAGSACTRVEPATQNEPRQGTGEAMLSEADAVKIAEADAVKAYDSLHKMLVRSELREGRWYVTYTHKPGVRGGGPSYVIDAKSGEILDKRYEQ